MMGYILTTERTMTNQPIISKEFGEWVRSVLGQDSFGKAHIKTTISQAYLMHMTRGKVPSQEIIMRLAEGYDVDPSPGLLAAGYIKQTTASEAIHIALRGVTNLSDEAKRQIEAFVKEMQEKYKVEKEG